MNLGFFGFPSYLDTSIIQIAKYDYSGTFYVPEHCNFLDILVIGGGGGGGGGRRSTSGTSAYGGGGGASGCLSFARIPVSDIIDNYETRFTKSRLLGVEIGAGGAGGAIATVDQTNGGAGGGGGWTYVYVFDLRFNITTSSILQIAIGGNGGSGGTNSSGTVASAQENSKETGNSHWNISMEQITNGSNAAINNISITRRLPNNSWGASGGSINSVGTKFTSTTGWVTSGHMIGMYDPTNSSLNPGENGERMKVLTNSVGFGGNGGQAIDSGGVIFTENGGRGYRGGGGGGGGGAIGVNSGAGGRGGNGFSLIIARHK